MGELTYVQKLEKDYLRIESKNKRYREALEFYADHQNLIDANDNPYFIITEVAQQALEDETE